MWVFIILLLLSSVKYLHCLFIFLCFKNIRSCGASRAYVAGCLRNVETKYIFSNPPINNINVDQRY